MTHAKRNVLVLWGQDFDEIATTIFVGELRKSGFRVKIVALHMQQTTGQHGLALTPDLSLDEALQVAIYTSCVVLPCAMSAVKQFSYDPRVAELFRLADTANALFVTGSKGAMYLTERITPQLLPTAFVQYPEVETLIPFVREVLPPLIGQ